MKGNIFTLMMKCIFIGTCITVLSPLLTTYTVTELDQLSELSFGFPFRFITQQSVLTPFEKDLPLELNYASPWENPTEFIIENFLRSLITTIIVVFFISICLSLILRIIYKFKKS